MYLPARFEEKDLARALGLVRAHPLATLIGGVTGDGAPMVNHLPLVVRAESPLVLAGHLARANPHTRALRDGDPVTAIFHGPNAYVSPSWYAEHDVPTWNYAVVHARGKLRWREDFAGLVEILKLSTDLLEKGPNAWEFGLPEDLADPAVLTRAIVGFEIEVQSLDAKFKLSQNRTEADRRGAIQGLTERGDPMSLRIAELMKEGL